MNQIPMIRILLLYSMRNLVQISKNYSDYTFSVFSMWMVTPSLLNTNKHFEIEIHVGAGEMIQWIKPCWASLRI